ncbi:hypothetical protein RF55_9532 [Lasius niger]|uniref:Uncharacterized protein n=1 Tax=Lasius niger TaxID=67767 RepID=A0A0J7KJP0_LASNI|nr:hypothetical protein RF55_9585 [Lasius niger]KMQ90681.1 hypothetical protein RF55_9532 [Lasius niger]
MSDESKEGKLVEGEGKKIGGEEGKKNVGRPKKIEDLSKKKRGSTGCMKDFFKKKKDEAGKEEREGGEWALRRSRRMEKLQEEGMWFGKEEIGKMISERFNELGEKLIKRLCEELRQFKVELWQKERKWREEKKKMGEKLEALEKKVSILENRIEEGAKGGGGEREATRDR